ncbi:hypothetical protein [Sinorhizobium meliloti]|uniref:hypothetical protein n=1 Tax=Rhizobium meliloti TaxID=382 RepID=UPI002380ABC5|nr:hypothetical protein [Sinorhizobium meliloti]
MSRRQIAHWFVRSYEANKFADLAFRSVEDQSVQILSDRRIQARYMGPGPKEDHLLRMIADDRKPQSQPFQGLLLVEFVPREIREYRQIAAVLLKVTAEFVRLQHIAVDHIGLQDYPR